MSLAAAEGARATPPASPLAHGVAPVGVVVAAATWTVAGAAAAALLLGVPVPGCPLLAALGVPCLACGSTRMAMALLDGRVGAAFLANPLVFTALAAILAWGAADLRRWSAGRPPLSLSTASVSWPVRLAALALVAASWLSVALRGG